ncbi:CbtA family protein [Sulfitobacter sp. D35]|uniref:CbtA family protein n=1 Tax=Sulfitobacter sp. D35 TaxID=3083252 RepID=UPI00296EBE1E|nr:CbtA family protein [Sulfitobacter sp. D35]MDW4496469.1 CbtA family protein [Sulfitobacter sp. D35]
MLPRILTSALLAGAATGLAAAALQLIFVQPVLLHAELYEAGVLEHFGADSPPDRPDLGGIDLMRDALSILFSMLIYTGYAIILVALMAQAEQRGAIISTRRGLIWGLCGYVALHMAPAFSLAPEVPGSAYVDLTARQVWWLATVLATALAMALIGFGKSWAAWAAALVLLLAPHLIGAPEPESFASPVPSELGALFAARTLGVGLVAWVGLGALAAHFWQRDTR